MECSTIDFDLLRAVIGEIMYRFVLAKTGLKFGNYSVCDSI